MTSRFESRLPRTRYLSFPFRMDDGGGVTSTRSEHIREQVMQVLLTSAGERVFRPEFGFGARQHVFEPNAPQLRELAQNRLHGSLAEALAGEVDPKTLHVEVTVPAGRPETLLVKIRYVIAALQKEESHEFSV